MRRYQSNLIYKGNAENRMTRVESAASVPAHARKREDWTYLPDGRWIERIVSTNNGSAYYPALTNRFVWDGRVLLAVLDHTNGLVMSFLRGMDLSGSVQGAGGVGGVLAVNFAPSTLNPEPSTHFVSYDGNGNVIALTDAATAETTAVFEYGPFGELLRSTGPMANAMPLRFSTMYADDVTGDVKYLYRDLRAEEGRWTSRDPIGEQGSLNLYVQVENDPVQQTDNLGLCACGVRIFRYSILAVTKEKVRMRVRIRYMKDADHSPSCCMFRQYLKGTYTLSGRGASSSPAKNGVGVPINDGQYHLDSAPYPGMDDDRLAVGKMYQNNIPDGGHDGTYYEGDDEPSWPGTDGVPGDTLNFKNEFLGIVKDLCNNNKEVKRISFSMSLTGTLPDLTYDPSIGTKPYIVP